MKFDKGPLVTLHLETKRDAVVKTTLSLSDAFICEGAPSPLLDWLNQYIEGMAPAWNLPPTKTAFQQEVLQALQTIPFGNTISYQQLAQLCGRPQSARAVGCGCGQNPLPLLIPCHRVIRSNGDIGGFALDLEIKRRLLKFEADHRPAPKS